MISEREPLRATGVLVEVFDGKDLLAVITLGIILVLTDMRARCLDLFNLL